MMFVAARRVPLRTACVCVRPRLYSEAFGRREQAAEAKAMADHDKQLLEKLKAKLRAEKGPDSESHAQMLERLQKAVRETVSVPKDVLAEAKADPITSEELMMLRKELMGRVRDLEDQLASLTLKKK